MRLQTLLDRRTTNAEMEIDDEVVEEEEEYEDEPDIDLDDMFAVMSDKPKKRRRVRRLANPLKILRTMIF